MLLTTAVVPGPPALVPELMGSAAGELDGLRDAIDLAVHEVLSTLTARSDQPPASGATSDPSSGPGGSGSAQLVVVGAGPPGEFDAAGPVSFASFGRDVTIRPLVGGHQGDRDLPTPIMVARYLASRDVAAHPEHVSLWACARWITTSGLDANALGARLGAPNARVGLILMADGAACHGPKAPRAQDARAEPYDESVRAALASGEPGALDQIDHGLGEELGATGAAVWPVLVAAAASAGGADGAGRADGAGSAGTGDAGPAAHSGQVLWSGAPYGVGWTVATWRQRRR